ncbi:HSP20-like chaperone [Dipodascopsis uninucleata]
MSLSRFFNSGSSSHREVMDPFRLLKIFDDPFFSTPVSNSLARSLDNSAFTSTPTFDVKETEKEFLLQGELPGVERNNLELEFTDPHTLSIRGRVERSEELTNPNQVATKTANEPEAKTEASGESAIAKNKNGATYWASERFYGEFARRFRFPSQVNSNEVSASLKNGILNIRVPKLEETASKKKIEIQEE